MHVRCSRRGLGGHTPCHGPDICTHGSCGSDPLLYSILFPIVVMRIEFGFGVERRRLRTAWWSGQVGRGNRFHRMGIFSADSLQGGTRRARATPTYIVKETFRSLRRLFERLHFLHQGILKAPNDGKQLMSGCGPSTRTRGGVGTAASSERPRSSPPYRRPAWHS